MILPILPVGEFRRHMARIDCMYPVPRSMLNWRLELQDVYKRHLDSCKNHIFPDFCLK